MTANRIGLLAGVALAVGVAGPASAQMVTEWAATVGGSWTGYTPTGVDLSVDGSTLTWGVAGSAGNRSSLVITEPGANEQLFTYIGAGVPPAVSFVDGLTLTHNNWPITGTTLESAQLTTTLDLTAIDPDLGVLPTNQIVYNILFKETLNSGTCAVDSPTPCNDIFVMELGALTQSFTFADVDYLVTIQADGLGQLSDAACAAAGAAAGCTGFTTPENGETDLQFTFAISTVPSVPEPGTLALLGAGLLGGAGAARRRRK